MFVACTVMVAVESMLEANVEVDPKFSVVAETLAFASTVAVTVNAMAAVPPPQLPGRVLATLPLTWACALVE